MKKSYKSYAVIGLGFGDEGKGVTVNSLVQQINNPLVVRYSGGQQAGHTVTLPDGTSHVFSNFGAGSLKSTPTYWSKYCTFDPIGVFGEFQVLNAKGYTPMLYLDKNSPITTPYDKLHNQTRSMALKHGTCGAGVGATYKREEKQQSLLVGDLLFPSIFQMKLKLIKEFYGTNPDMKVFLEACHFVRNNHSFRIVDQIPFHFDELIFESSQGLLLDQNIGFFPHVTPSNVGSKNILEMGYEPQLFLVTRAFQTRHGHGPMTNLDIPHNIKENPKETNVLNRFQGEFKRSLLDLDLLKYGIEKDPYIKQNLYRATLVVTCLDLVVNEYRYTVNGKIVSHADEESFIKGIADELNIDAKNIQTISSPDGIVRLERLQWAV